MANQFDGPNLIITLEPVVGGVLTVDVLESIYEDAKDWYRAHPDNRKYPFPFVSDGGNPLTTVLNQGQYIFLQNEDGWRIRPAENDGTYYFIGNLGVQSTELPALVPTIGGHTVGIFGLQPITQVAEASSNLTAAQVWDYVLDGSYSADQMLSELHLFKGLNGPKPVTISGDGVTTSVLTADGKTITITTTDMTRT